MATYSRASRLMAAYDGKYSSGNYGGFGPVDAKPTRLRVYMFFSKRAKYAGRPMMMLHVAAFHRANHRRKR